MPDQEKSLRAPQAINTRALLLAIVITCGLIAITWLTATPHIVTH